ncbi:UNVERIFIED_CONTAM: hypothetical protein NCL1_51937 [Trichonephila clavipes]
MRLRTSSILRLTFADANKKLGYYKCTSASYDMSSRAPVTTPPGHGLATTALELEGLFVEPRELESIFVEPYSTHTFL